MSREVPQVLKNHPRLNAAASVQQVVPFMSHRAQIAPSQRTPAPPNSRLLALMLVLLPALALTLPLSAQTPRVVGPVTFEDKSLLGVEVDDLELVDFDGAAMPKVTFQFASAESDDGGAAVRVGPEDAAYVQGQGLEGPTDSVLTLIFEEPVVGFQAGMAFLANRAEDLAVRLEAATDQGVAVFGQVFPSTIGAATLYPGTLVQGDFDAPATVIRLRIESTARRFFLDNLVFTFEAPDLPGLEPPEATVFEGRARQAKIVRLADSGSAAAWPEDGQIRFQSISKGGQPEGPIRIATAVGQSGWAPTMAAHDGGFALAWYGRGESANAPPEGVYLRLHEADGTPRGARLRIFSPQTRRATRIELGIASSKTELILTWADGEKLGAVRYDPIDKVVAPIELSATNSTCGLQAAVFSSRIVTIWCTEDQLWAQFHDSQGAPDGEPVSLSSGLEGSARDAQVASAPTTDAHSHAIVWVQEQTGEQIAGYVRTMTEDGLLSPAIRVSSVLAKATNPTVAGTADGSFLVSWLAPGNPGQSEFPRRLLAKVFYATGVAASGLLEPMAGLNADPETIAVSWNGRRATVVWENSLSSLTLPGSYVSTFTAEADRTPCRIDSSGLCLQGNRFRVSVQYRDFDGMVGEGRPVTLTSDTGYFWFFDQGAADLVVKVLDGRAANGHHWVFFGSLTNVAFDLMVEDRVIGKTATYSNEIGSFASAGDTGAFKDLGSPNEQEPLARSAWDDLLPLWPTSQQAPTTSEYPTCSAALSDHPLAACLSDRFLVEVEWQDFGGTTGDGHGTALSADTASFWFFDAANVELVVKVLDGSAINDHYWVFFGSLTNVSFELTVTDLRSGTSRTWANPSGTFASQGDTTALPAD